MRRIWMHEIYTYMCSDYIKRNPNKINILEAILFLMQIESFENYKKPFYKYKTYIYDNTIRIPYLSDLLRISPIVPLSNDHIYWSRRIDKYSSLFKKYKKMSEQEIFEKVASYTKCKNNSKYFKIEKYSNINFRRLARLKISDSTVGIIKFLLRKFSGALALVFSFSTIMLLCLENYITRTLMRNDIQTIYFIICGLAIIFDIIWWVWTWHCMKPTKHEIKYGYLSD